MQALVRRLQLDGRRTSSVDLARDALLEALDSIRDERWAALTLQNDDRTLNIVASGGVLSVSYDPYPARPDYPDSPFWNLEGKPEATEGFPQPPAGILTVEDADLSQFVERANAVGQTYAAPRRWCVTKDQAVAALDEYLTTGEIDLATGKWVQMEFGPAPPAAN